MGFVPAYSVIAAPRSHPRRSVFFVHGILGSKKHWRSFARRFVARFPAWRAVLVDLRNHGSSRPAPPPHDITACAGDLHRLGEALGRPSAVVGHSFGGKVVLRYLAEFGSDLEASWVLDGPVGPEAGGGRSEVARLVDELAALTLPVARRSDVSARLGELGFSDVVARWMATNLHRDASGGYVFDFDLEGVRALLESYWTADLLSVLTRNPSRGGVHLLYAARSDRWSREQLEELAELVRPGRFELHRLPDAGHWLHIDDPEGLLDALAQTFDH
jgi:pimeloyl-ACP methyl ester carboxylesterase